MENGDRAHQYNFLVRCAEASKLVHNFLTDSLPLGLVPERRKDFTYDNVKRRNVKEKINASLRILEKTIDVHGYVILYSRS